MSKYFDCIAIWRNIIPDTNIEPIKTIELVGYYNDQKLAYNYISKLLDTLDHLRKLIQEEYRNKKKVRRNTLTSNNLSKGNSRTRAYRITGEKIELLTNTWIILCRDKKIISEKLITMILNIEDHLSLDYRNYKGKTFYTHAICRQQKFQNNRIIRL